MGPLYFWAEFLRSCTLASQDCAELRHADVDNEETESPPEADSRFLFFHCCITVVHLHCDLTAQPILRSPGLFADRGTSQARDRDWSVGGRGSATGHPTAGRGIGRKPEHCRESLQRAGARRGDSTAPRGRRVCERKQLAQLTAAPN